MSCLFLLNSLTIGGSEKKSVRLAHALNKRGHDIHVAYLSPPDDLRMEIDDDIPVLFLDRNGKFDFRALSRLNRYLNDHEINNLFCMNLYPYLYGCMARVLAGSAGIRCLAFINITDFLLLKEKLQMPLYSSLLRLSSRLVFGCRAQQQQWTGRYLLPRKRSTVIYNGVDCAFFSTDNLTEDPAAQRERFGFSRDDFIVTVVADLRPEKSHADLIAACAILARSGDPVRLVLAGDGPEKDRLERQVAELDLSNRVHFWGSLSDVRPALGVADVFALPSVAVETFSNAALEAMAMGKPVVLSDIGGASEMVFPGENGYLFPPSDIDALTNILGELIHQPDLRRAMGEKARSIARERFGFEQMVDQYESLLLAAEGGAKESTAQKERRPE